MKRFFASRTRLVGLLAVLLATPLYFVLFGAQDNANKRTDQAAVILDLGGVLMETKHLASARQLGLQNLFWYYISTGKSPKNIKKRFYSFLNTIYGSKGNTSGAKDDQGLLLPELMCDWLRGTRTCRDIRTFILTQIKSKKDWFYNKSEQKMLKKLAMLIFTPEQFVETQKPVSEGIKFVKECKKRGYLVYVLSNWDHESFDLLVKQHQKLFRLFDGIIISGDVHALKPDDEIFEHFTKRLVTENCIFIDDRPENVKAARKHGIHGIRCRHKKSTFSSKPDFDKVRKELTKWEQKKIQSARIATLSYPQSTAVAFAN